MCEMYTGEVELFGQKNKNIRIFDDLSFDIHALENSNKHQVKADLIANMLYTFLCATTSGPTLC